MDAKKHNKKTIATKKDRNAILRKVLELDVKNKSGSTKKVGLSLGGVLAALLLGKKKALLGEAGEREGPPAVRDWAEKMGVPFEEALRRWRKAETIASKKFTMPPLTKGGTFQKTPTGKFWKYAMAIFKKMMYQAKGQSKAKGRKVILKRAAEHPPMEPGPPLRRRKARKVKNVRRESFEDKETTMERASLEERVKRMKKSAVKARSKAAKKPMTGERRKRAKAMKKWRKANKSKVKAYQKKYKPKESLDIDFDDALDLIREGISPEVVVDAMASGELDGIFNAALVTENDDDEISEELLAVASLVSAGELDESEFDEIVDYLDDEEVDILNALLDEDDEDADDEDLDEDELDEMEFDAYFAKLKKGNPKISRSGAQKMYDAMMRMKKKNEDVDEDDEDGDEFGFDVAERARWKKELISPKLKPGLQRHRAAQLKKKFGKKGREAKGVGAQVIRGIAKRGEQAKRGKWGKSGSQAPARTGKAKLRQRHAEIMGRGTKGTRSSRASLKKSLRQVGIKRRKSAGGKKAHRTKARREKARASLVKARAAKAAKRGQ